MYFLFLSLYFSASMIAQTHKMQSPLIQAEFDAVVTQIWLSANQANMSGMKMYVDKLPEEWKKCVSIFEKSHTPHFDMPGFLKDVDGMVNNLVLRISEQDINGVKDIAYHILLEMRSMRICAGQDVFPLDELWWLYDEYEGIRYVVNDKMFGKYEWFEFKDMVYQLQCKYEIYDFISNDILKSFYPDLNTSAHGAYKMELAKCVGDFMNSLKSAYQPDFVAPCNEIGYKLKQIMALYQPNPKRVF